MAIDIKFDLVGNPEPPTIILATRNGDKLGQLQVNEDSIELSDKFNDASEISFTVNKYIDGKITPLWDKLVDFKLVYCKEWDLWFEITVELDEETETVKTVFCTQLGQAELSQIMLYNIEINTEKDIERDDYKISILYDENDPKSSILNRMLEKAPHYSIIHVDDTIKNIQRTFSFDGSSIYDSFQEIAEEIGCLFVFHSNSGEDGKIQRTISVYDLQQYCWDCGYRGEYIDKCPKCDSTNIKYGYGDDTLIFVTSDELASEGIELVTDTDAVKNCFKLEAGDDLMTATIRNCNPNGSDYIWYISDEMKSDMSQKLIDKLDYYNAEYKRYQKTFKTPIKENEINKYNTLVRKYKVYNDDLAEISYPIVGYASLMNAYYNTIDLASYLQTSLMPTVEMSDTSAIKEASKLTKQNISPVSLDTIANISIATANSAVLSMAKIIVDSRYKVKVSTSSLEKSLTHQIWTGNFTVTNYSDEEDTATSEIISVEVNDDYASFVQQRIDKALSKDDEKVDDLSISGLFKKDYNDFVSELKKYSLDCLESFYNSGQGCIDILIDQGIANKDTWSGEDPNLYEDLYQPYMSKMSAIASEIKIRQAEIDSIVGVYNVDGELETYGLQTYIVNVKTFMQKILDFEYQLGTDLWKEFCTFRREDKYSNENYISDGLNNAELFKRALEFIEVAENEIYKSAELQHSISTTLNNLLSLPKFKSLVKSFKLGNWMRVKIDDAIYKLRLLQYDISYGDFNNIPVEFSDVTKIKSGITDVQSVLSQATSMATSYNAVQKQAQQGEKSNTILSHWVEDGLDATNTRIIGGADNQTQSWDEHGMLFKKYDSINDTYEDTQLKIINSTLAITDDNWDTVKTAVGAYYYYHPETGKLTKAYGVNAETLVGKLILGEQLGIYNESGSLSFDNSGFKVSSKDNVNSFTVDPNSDVLVAISHDDQKVFWIDENGKLHITGDGSGLEISSNTDITNLSANVTSLNSEIKDKVSYNDLSASGKTIINGDNITTGTLSAKDIKIDGKFEVWEGSMTGGYLGYMSGESDDGETIGIGMSNFSEDCYAIATWDGVRLQAGKYSIFITTSGVASIKAEEVVIDGNLTVNGNFTHNNTSV